MNQFFKIRKTYNSTTGENHIVIVSVHTRFLFSNEFETTARHILHKHNENSSWKKLVSSSLDNIIWYSLGHTALPNLKWGGLDITGGILTLCQSISGNSERKNSSNA